MDYKKKLINEERRTIFVFSTDNHLLFFTSELIKTVQNALTDSGKTYTCEIYKTENKDVATTENIPEFLLDFQNFLNRREHQACYIKTIAKIKNENVEIDDEVTFSRYFGHLYGYGEYALLDYPLENW